MNTARLLHIEAARRVLSALEAVCREGPRTPDIGGSGSTIEVGDAVAGLLASGRVTE